MQFVLAGKKKCDTKGRRMTEIEKDRGTRGECERARERATGREGEGGQPKDV